MTHTAGRVYSYLRFSDAKQAAGASTERQQAYAEAWAKQHGLVLDDALSMRDEGLSAYHSAHIRQGALGVFLRAVEDGTVPPGSVLIVEGLDRLSRAEPIKAQAQLTQIITAGITVVTASDGKAYSREHLKANPMDLVYSLLVMIRAHEESDTKSKRVRDALRRQCLGWSAGTYRGLVRVGQSPGWLHVVDGRWQLLEPRAAAVRLAVDLFRQGLGTGAISKRLHADGLQIGSGTPTSGHLVRLLSNVALVGDKVVKIGQAEEYTLADYYPALLTRPEFEELQHLAAGRARRKVKGDLPSILTGFGVCFCGYCGAPMKAQNMLHTRRDDGTMRDGNRRISCTATNSGAGCAVPGSASIVPIERALLRYCSDLVNLQALYTADTAAAPRSALAKARARLAEIDTQLDRLATALLETDTPPATFVRKAAELEAERAALQEQARASEVEIAAAARADLAGADVRWRTLAAGVEELDYTARMQARQLVADTFERVAVYHHGTRPQETPKGVIDVMLLAKGGKARMLRIDKAGELLACDDVSLVD